MFRHRRCHPQAVLQIKVMQTQHAIRSMLRRHWMNNFMTIIFMCVCFFKFSYFNHSIEDESYLNGCVVCYACVPLI